VTCTQPQRWELAQTGILRFELLDPAPYEVGRVTRVLAYVETSGEDCAEYAGHEVAVDPATRLAHVAISLWRKVDALAGPCAPAAEPTRVVVNLRSLTAGTWTVMDGSAGATGDPVTATVEVAPCDATCSCPDRPGDRGQGVDCTLDCQCREGLVCLGYLGLDGTLERTCQPSCSDDRDCRTDERCVDHDDGPSRTCELMPMGCNPATPCPAGQQCPCAGSFCFCRAAQAVEGPACCRNEDCPEGNVCIGGPEGASCGVPCRHDFNCAGELDLCQVPPDTPGTCSRWAE